MVTVILLEPAAEVNDKLVVLTLIFGVGVGVAGFAVGVAVGATLWATVILMTWPLPVSVISTCPVLAFPVFAVTLMDTVFPFTLAVTHPLASIFVSARRVPLLFVTVTLLVSDAEVKLNDVALTLIFGVGVGAPVTFFVGVGVLVGFFVGVGVFGFFVGVLVGFFVGVMVGFFVGVGVLVGFFVGVGVGAALCVMVILID